MKKHLIVSFVLLLAFTACNSPAVDKGKEKASMTRLASPVAKPDADVIEEDASAPPPANEAMADKSAESPQANAAPANGNVVTDTTKKIIKEGEINFETGDVAETRKQVLASLKKLGGYVDNDSETTNGEENRKEFVLNIRIPAKNFDAFLGNVSATATKIDSRNIRIQDVTAQFIDIKTRLNNKKLLENRYQDLLKKATKISDLLDIENKLTEIRSDIESTQTQLNYMSKQVAYSSLSITFYTRQVAQVDAGFGFMYKLKQSAANGWGFLQSFFFGIISLWPLWLTVLIIYLLIKRWARRNSYKE
jgi:truncated hemoglobin YjbI